MNIATFLKTQADIVSRFESGFSGYRGLSGEDMDFLLDENIPGRIIIALTYNGLSQVQHAGSHQKLWRRYFKPSKKEKRTCKERTQPNLGLQHHQVTFLEFLQDLSWWILTGQHLTLL